MSDVFLNFINNNIDGNIVGGVKDRQAHINEVSINIKYHAISSDSKFDDLHNKKFNRWSVLGYIGGNKRGSYWHCICDCGNYGVVTQCALRNESSKSCGCLKAELLRARKGHGYLEHGQAAINSAFYGYIYGAESRGIEWKISMELFINITSQNCHYCGRPPSQMRYASTKESGMYLMNGIDRIDSDPDIGYIDTNILPCCKTCNWMKHVLTYNEFIEHIGKIYNHLINKKDV